ncbi:putative bifunctional diguanylate cyclase/phosphodiesterase [Sphingomonas sp. HT-1]|uniref:putative bifunctional diguanylate cyclase/phosphodiesterase n=1 Tax=unclassified Sphingomonas TaxID=196159 RepID=UPI0004745BE4|nr:MULTISPECIES: EAL domain-containing protein [unclassified Sphingomonas]KTF69751.1 diguanylate cyclase [Sphingomonas sp. WG]
MLPRVSSKSTSSLPLPTVDTRALLGLRDAADAIDWQRMRAAQLHAGRRFAPLLLATQITGTAMVLVTLWPRISPWPLAAWAMLVICAAGWVARRRLAFNDCDAIAATLADVRKTLPEAILLGLLWSVPALAFGTAPSEGIGVNLWAALMLVITAMAIAMGAIPMASLLFVGIMGISSGAALLAVGAPLVALAAVLLSGILAIGSFSRGRTLVLLRANQIALADRDETVSLLLREFEETGSDWLWEIDAQRRVARASPRFALSLGLDPKTINGIPFLQALTGAQWESGRFASELHALSDKLRAREPFRDFPVPVQVSEEQRWWEISASPKFDERGVFLGFRGVASDVTEQRRANEKIHRMARFDALTGLPNRLHINETLAQAMAEADKWGALCAFMMIDLDRFKAVNDTLGHPVGDRLLQRVAERLKRLTGTNEMIGRLGGDEFAVVVRHVSDPEGVERLAQAIIDTVSRPYEVDQHTLYIGASVGVAIGPRDGRTAEMLVRSADLALYRSKDAGGGVFHAYEPQLHVAAEERRVLEIALRGAVEQGQTHLTYQPVVNASTGGLIGFEALLRWTHPEFGVVPPAKFVPLAEETRLISAIGEWVLRTACMEAARWDLPARIAVNVSSEQLHSPAFAAIVADALASSGLEPGRLELEVTESVFLREGTSAVATLERILALGVQLSLDDFGTGYSSLGYLAHTRFSSIKIDRGFVQSASRGTKEAIAIIRAVVALAESLGMATTAEGVETEDEHRMVRALGCSRAQGYHFGRPLPVQEARMLVSNSGSATIAA